MCGNSMKISRGTRQIANFNRTVINATLPGTTRQKGVHAAACSFRTGWFLL